MLLLVRKADDVLTLYKDHARLLGQNEELEKMIIRLNGKIGTLLGREATLEQENELLLREVEHWKAKAQFNKDEVKNGS